MRCGGRGCICPGILVKVKKNKPLPCRERSEYMDHFKQISEKLASRELDAVLLTAAPNRLYASGFPSTAGMALATRDGAWFFVDSRYIEVARKRIPNAEVLLVDRDHSYTRLIEDVVQTQSIRRRGFEDAMMSVAEYESLRKALSCELTGASELMDELRAVKDAEEIETLIAAQRIAERALQEILNDIRPGVTEKAIAARIEYLMRCYGAEKTSFDTIVVSGANSSMPHGVPSDKKIEAGDFVTMDFGCKLNGYCSDMTRTVAVGHATDEMRTVYQTVLEAQLAGIAAARAGVTGREVDGAARKVIADAGYGEYFGHGFGHGLGVEIHEAPTAAPSYDRPLPAGAVISAEPGIYLPGKLGVRIEDVIVLEENGSRNITLAPKELLIL